MNHSQKKNNAQNLSRSSTILLAAGSTFLVIGLIWAGTSIFLANRSPQNINPNDVVTAEDEPSENKPSNDGFNVPADQPRQILFEGLEIRGFVQKVGKNASGDMAAPNNVHLAGWYVNSAPPGQAGLSIIDGHVSGRHTDGIFKRLSDTKKGMRFKIEFGDRSTKTFEVVSVKQVSENEADSVLFQKDGAFTSQLNLVTCGGNFDNRSQTYSDRIIVISKPEA